MKDCECRRKPMFLFKKETVMVQKKKIYFCFPRFAGKFFVFIFCMLFAAVPAFSQTLEQLDQRIKKRDTSFYRDFFDNVLYKPFAKFLRFDQLDVRSGLKKNPARDINLFDEVPDSGFFINRQGREP